MLVDDAVPADASVLARWIDLHIGYGRVWTPVYALQADIVAWHEARQLPQHDQLEATYVSSSLWWYARFLVAVYRHMEEYGGLWLLADREAEVAVSNAVYRLEWHPPFAPEQDSYLRVSLRADEHHDYLPFVDRLSRDRGAEVLSRWRTWLDSCDCRADEPSRRCEVHETARACDTFCRLIEEDWDRVVGRSRQAAIDVHGISTSDLIERYWPQATRRQSPLIPPEGRPPTP